MIAAFESMVRTCPEHTCFTFVDETGKATCYSYRHTRLVAANIALQLESRGVRQGDYVTVDMPNCPEFIFLMLAAAYSGFVLVPFNHRMTPKEKLTRSLELERQQGVCIALRIDKQGAARLLSQAKLSLSGRANDAVSQTQAGRSYGRVIMGVRQDAEEEAIHYAERSAHLFDENSSALIMFTSGSTGRPKAVVHTWRQLTSSARAANASLSTRGEGVWQLVLPLYHIGGFQIVVRSILNRCSFILYERFKGESLLYDVARFRVTHVSVVNKMLQDMLAVGNDEALAAYQCILLGGGAPNRQAVESARLVGARVYVSYGMTETSSQIAHALVTDTFDGGLHLLAGYSVRIIDSQPDGFGRLAVRGPGVFAGYLNQHAAFTVDGYFLTGDTAALSNGCLYVKERIDDMFVSGGENVYPAEIVNALLQIPGVTDAYVCGVPDATWGRRPVAFVESAAKGASRLSVDEIRAALRPCLSKISTPQHICVVDTLPRTAMGKISRKHIEDIYENRIEIAQIIIYQVRFPFIKPFVTAKNTLDCRDSLIVEVVDNRGRRGLGECSAFATDWYLPETLDQDFAVIQEVLAPKVLHEVYLHPRQASASFASLSEAVVYPLACAAVESALWDLYGKIVRAPLWELIGIEAERIKAEKSGTLSAFYSKDKASMISQRACTEITEPGRGSCFHRGAGTQTLLAAGAVVGMGEPAATVAEVKKCLDAGYRRVKLKVSPGKPVACAQAVRAAYPHLMLMLDANQSFTEAHIDELRLLDTLGAVCIEEPLDPVCVSGGQGDLFARLASLQRSFITPFCLDESFVCARDAYRALGYTELRCFALKVGKFGGVRPALEFVHAAQSRGAMVWMGGMYDTGVFRRLHAAFQTLPGITIPGDIGSLAHYFSTDITDPAYSVDQGKVFLNSQGYEYGLGCVLSESALDNVLVQRVVLK